MVGDWSVLPTACSDRTCRLVLVKDDWLQEKAGFGEVIGRFYLLLVVTEPLSLC